jgi:hypothetical protein
MDPHVSLAPVCKNHTEHENPPTLTPAPDFFGITQKLLKTKDWPSWVIPPVYRPPSPNAGFQIHGTA